MTLDLPQIVQRFSLDLGGLKRGEAEVGGIFGRIAGASSRAGSALTKGISLPLAALGGFAIESAIKVEEAQFKIRRGTGETGTVLAQLNKDFAAVGRQTARSFSDVADIITNVHQRLGLVGGPLQALTLTILRLQKVTGDTAPTVDDITRLFAQWGVQTRNQTSTLDLLYRATERSGIPMNQLVGILDQFGPHLRAVGFSVASAAALLASLSKAGIDAGQVMGGLRKFFTAAAKAGKDPAVAFADVIKQMRLLVEEGKKTEAQNLGIKMFGTRGVGLIRAIIEGKLQYQAFLDTISKGRDTIAASAASTVSLGDQFKILKNKAELSLAPIGERFFPLIAKVINAAIPILNVFASVLDRLGPAVVPIGAALITLGPGLIIFGKLSKAATEAAQGIGGLGRVLGSIGRFFGITAAQTSADTAAMTANTAAKTANATATAAQGVAAGATAAEEQALAVVEGEVAAAAGSGVVGAEAMAAAFHLQGVAAGEAAVAEEGLAAASTGFLGVLGPLAVGVGLLAGGLFVAFRRVDPTRKALADLALVTKDVRVAETDLAGAQRGARAAQEKVNELRKDGKRNTSEYRDALKTLRDTERDVGSATEKVLAGQRKQIDSVRDAFAHLLDRSLLDKVTLGFRDALQKGDETTRNFNEGLFKIVTAAHAAGVSIETLRAIVLGLDIPADKKARVVNTLLEMDAATRQLTASQKTFAGVFGDTLKAATDPGIADAINNQLAILSDLASREGTITSKNTDLKASVSELVRLLAQQSLAWADQETKQGHVVSATLNLITQLENLEAQYPKLKSLIDPYIAALEANGRIAGSLSRGELKQLDDRLKDLGVHSHVRALIEAKVKDDPNITVKELDALLKGLGVPHALRTKIEASVVATVKLVVKREAAALAPPTPKVEADLAAQRAALHAFEQQLTAGLFATLGDQIRGRINVADINEALKRIDFSSIVDNARHAGVSLEVLISRIRDLKIPKANQDAIIAALTREAKISDDVTAAQGRLSKALGAPVPVGAAVSLRTLREQLAGYVATNRGAVANNVLLTGSLHDLVVQLGADSLAWQKQRESQGKSGDAAQHTIEQLKTLKQQYPQLADLIDQYIAALERSTAAAARTTQATNDIHAALKRVQGIDPNMQKRITAALVGVVNGSNTDIRAVENKLNAIKNLDPTIRKRIIAALEATLKISAPTVDYHVQRLPNGDVVFYPKVIPGAPASHGFVHKGGIAGEAPYTAARAAHPDEIFALLRRKEFVIREEAADVIGPQVLYALNRATSSRDVAALFAATPRFHEGGTFGAPAAWNARPSGGASSTTYDQRATHLTILNPKPQAAEDSIQRQLRALVYLGWIGPESR